MVNEDRCEKSGELYGQDGREAMDEEMCGKDGWAMMRGAVERSFVSLCGPCSNASDRAPDEDAL